LKADRPRQKRHGVNNFEVNREEKPPVGRKSRGERRSDASVDGGPNAVHLGYRPWTDAKKTKGKTKRGRGETTNS